MSEYAKLAELPLEIEGYSLERRELEVSSRFKRVTTTVVLRGSGEEGRGEDVTYDAEEHEWFPENLPLAGRYPLGELAPRLDGWPLFRSERNQGSQNHRRWALESAALDLALRQAGRSLGDATGRAYRPVRFVVSTRAKVQPWLDVDPTLEFKLDAGADWSRPLIAELASTGRVRVVDFKAYYAGDWVGEPPNASVYRDVLELLPDAIVEDAGFTAETRELLVTNANRLSFDAPIHSLDDLTRLEVEPRILNVKPSRFGTLERLFACLDYCEERRIRMYGGGQFELGVGRSQVQALASLYYPEGPNDVAPAVYNKGGPRRGLPSSPLEPPHRPSGFSFSQDR
jgi:L-alanine-DL-glutamate epimerase-like enolase superfamily enzyme